jgi:hypothetical protein
MAKRTNFTRKTGEVLNTGFVAAIPEPLSQKFSA